ncbi:MAG: tail fiber domain-containing protein, partial [Candidatus Nomurabacteria bacterium]|nr:tail fiber domain-containing protein [Candidatus Nomurabacteria bacterium]
RLWADGSIRFQTAPSGTAGSALDGTAFDTTGVKMVIKNDGNVGIGTTNPSDKLDVWDGNLLLNKTGLAHGMTSLGVTTLGGRLSINDIHGGAVLSGFTDATSVNSAVSTFAVLGSASPTYSAIQDFVGKKNAATWQALASNEIAYKLTNFSTDLVTVLGSGNVGIGTTAPEAKMDIIGAQQGTVTTLGSEVPGLIIQQRLTNDANGDKGPMLEFRATNASDAWTQAAITGVASGTYAGQLAFFTQPGGTTDPTGRRSKGASLVEAMRIIENGNVGIGTTNPGSTLSVGGTTAINWTNGTGLVTVGNLGTGGSLFVNTAGYNNGNSSGLGIDGTFAGGIGGTSTVNLKAYGVNSAGGYNSALTFSTTKNTTLSEWMRIDQNGNVGIGTTGPSALLHLSKNPGANTVVELLRLDTSLFGDYEGSGGKIVFRDIGVYADTATIEAKRIAGSGESILSFRLRNAATAQMIIANTGVVSIANLVSCGGIQTNGSGTMSCTSDARLKDIKGNFTPGLDAIMQINPQTYSWKTDSGLYDGGIDYSGFIAQNVETAIPEAVNINPSGNRQVNTTTILAASINAIKEMNLKLEDLSSLDTTKATSLGSLITRFLADMGNNVTDLYASVIHSDKVVTKEIEMKDSATGEDYCVVITNGEFNKKKGKCGAEVVDETPPLTDAEIEAARVAEINNNLATAKTTANDKVEADYTGASWLLFTPARTLALALPEVVESTPAQTGAELEANKTAKTTALNNAMTLLELLSNQSSDITALTEAKGIAQGLINDSAAESANVGDHVEGSLATLIAANNLATGTIADTQTVIDDQVSALNTAITTYNAAIVQ